MLKVDELANALQVCLDSGAKKVLLPITSAAVSYTHLTLPTNVP